MGIDIGIDIKKYKDIEKASVDQIIQAVEKYDGVFLFTTLNKYYPSNLNIVGLNPVIKIYDDKTIIKGSEHRIKGFEAIKNILKNNDLQFAFKINKNVLLDSELQTQPDQ